MPEPDVRAEDAGSIFKLAAAEITGLHYSGTNDEILS